MSTTEVAVPELADGEVIVLSIPAYVLVHVGRDGVQQVTIMPNGTVSSDLFDVYEAEAGQGAAVESAVAWASANPWPPLTHLPADVVWEG